MKKNVFAVMLLFLLSCAPEKKEYVLDKNPGKQASNVEVIEKNTEECNGYGGLRLIQEGGGHELFCHDKPVSVDPVLGEFSLEVEEWPSPNCDNDDDIPKIIKIKKDAKVVKTLHKCISSDGNKELKINLELKKTDKECAKDGLQGYLYDVTVLSSENFQIKPIESICIKKIVENEGINLENFYYTKKLDYDVFDFIARPYFHIRNGTFLNFYDQNGNKKFDSEEDILIKAKFVSGYDSQFFIIFVAKTNKGYLVEVYKENSNMNSVFSFETLDWKTIAVKSEKKGRSIEWEYTNLMNRKVDKKFKY